MKQDIDEEYPTEEELEETMACLKEANENATWWKNRYEAQVKINKELHERIDKAINYLEESNRDNFDYSKAYLIQLLQGSSDKE